MLKDGSPKHVCGGTVSLTARLRLRVCSWFDLSSLRVDALPNFMTSILCYYFNASRTIQQIQLHTATPSLDRMVFPGEKIMFESLPEDLLEIYTYTTSGLQLFQTIACSQLEVLSRTRAELEN
jgi:Domain of unknown function (DUF1830)